ncbi:MAG TPA: hypothetical protein DGR97_12105 [Gammaproteobacteria bacterium]|nr:hypothetical protein [Gammaproteobacteria bacterium]|tara:strand:+ start:227 stop:1330 length:1104 start_codon:yes stop_codon:yes gene_type:complete
MFDHYDDPEDAYNFGIKIKQLVKEKNLEGLFALVEGELTGQGPRKQFIVDKKFSDIFSDDWRKNLLHAYPPCSPVAWGAFVLKSGSDSGSILFNRKDGKWHIFSIKGAQEEDIPGSNMPIGWEISEGIIPPQCFVREWHSSDNFEAFEDKYKIPKEDCWNIEPGRDYLSRIVLRTNAREGAIDTFADWLEKSGSKMLTHCQSTNFRKNPGMYFGKEIPSLDGIFPNWDDSPKERITLAAPVDLCFKGSVIGGVIGNPMKLSVKTNNKSKKIESKIGSSEDYYTEYAYRILTNVPLNKCQELAPNLKGQCTQSFLIEVGDYGGGMMGWDYGYNIYGLFSFKDERRFIVPLKNFQNPRHAINYIEQSVK